MILSAYFLDNDTANGRFTGTITVYEVSPWLKVVDAAAMVSNDDGFYTYNFIAHDWDKDYVYICKGVDSLGGPDRYVRAAIDAKPSVNVQYVNDTEVTGVGTSANPWRPA